MISTMPPNAPITLEDQQEMDIIISETYSGNYIRSNCNDNPEILYIENDNGD